MMESNEGEKKDKNLEKLEKCTNMHSVKYLHSYVFSLTVIDVPSTVSLSL